MADKLDIKPFIQAFKKARRTLPIKLGQGAVLFFKDNIRKRQGFLDQRLEKWKPLKRKRRGKGGRIKRGQDILKDTGTLLKSISRAVTTFNEIKIVSKGVAYAGIHNEGGVTHPKVTDKMRAWARFRAKKVPAKERGIFNAIANTKKKTLTVKIPQRKFIGDSKQLTKALQRKIDRELRGFLKKA